MLRFLRRLIHPSWRRPYHQALARLAAARFGWPSRRLVVIGVTGTDGKTTTATLLAAALAGSGQKVGLSSTVWFQVGDRRWLNETHMTMPGRFQFQALLRRMADAGCRYAVLEVSSEGLAQGRLTGVDIDVAVLTNISPEHIESHGSFEKYRAAKKKLFTTLATSRRKQVAGRTVPKMVVVNGDDAEASFFLNCQADQKTATSLQAQPNVGQDVDICRAMVMASDEHGTTFTVDGSEYRVQLPGAFNVANALQAITVARGLGLPADKIAAGLRSVTTMPGRFETIISKKNVRVVIDYAVTPVALRALYATLQTQYPGAKLIAVFGAAGAGRDHWKRPELGKIASEFATHIMLTSEDPFDEDPAVIADAILAGVAADKKAMAEVIVDRRAAIQAALKIAQPGDVIALTGMGSETTMNVAGGKKIEWSDRRTVESLMA